MNAQSIIRFTALLFLLVSIVFMFSTASGQTKTSFISSAVIAKAMPDECYKGLGLNGPLPIEKPPCVAPAIAKTNQAYLWSMATANNDDVWFGTAANVLCTAQDPINPVPRQTAGYACEFGLSPYAFASGGNLPAIYGDWRVPLIYLYNESTGQLTDMTPVGPSGLVTATTLGLRAAAVIDDLVLLAGPNLNAVRGINVFAFQESTKRFLGSTNLPFSDIRQFTRVNGVSYAGVASLSGPGAIIRWTGTVSPRCRSCFTYEIVGNLDNEASYLTEHNGRLFATTWTQRGAPLSGLWMSPPIPQEGLTSTNANSWTKVWDFGSYEPDPFIVQTYGGGPLKSFGGYLYWGTMHNPWNSMAHWMDQYGTPATPEDQSADFQGTLRSVAIFRGSDFDSNPTVDLLYGEAQLPVYQPDTNTWTMTNNNMPVGHNQPLYGPSGFGNRFNTYTWSMSIWNNRLWIGTFDWSQPAYLSGFTPMGGPFPPGYIDPANFGADLFSFANSSSPANLEDQNGLGNITNYGIRNMATTDKLYFGTANNMNLLTDPSAPMGGWELIQAAPN